MPIKDKEKAREYKRLWIANKRKEGKNVEPNVEPSPVVEPQFVEPLKCSRCPEIENSITNFYNLVIQEQEKVKEQKKINYQLEKKVKDLESQLKTSKKQLKNHGLPK